MYIKKISYNKRIFLFIDILVILFCVLGVYQIIQKADLTQGENKLIKVHSSHSGIVVDSVFQSSLGYITAGDTIISINGYNFHTGEELELYLDGKQIGDKVDIEYIHDEELRKDIVVLVNFYSSFYIISVVIVGFIYIVLAMFVLLRRFDKSYAHLFHWLSMGVAIIMTMTWGNYKVVPFELGMINRIGLHIGYSFAPALLIYFSLTFPVEKKFNKKLVLIPLYLVSTIFVIALSICFLMSISGPSIYWMRKYAELFDICRYFLPVGFVTSLILFIHNYRIADTESDRKKMGWMIIGLVLGPLCYIVLWSIPYSIMTDGLVPEELVIILMAAVPITFSIAIVKYRLMDIDIIINKSIVYTIVLVFLIIIYISIVAIITSTIDVLNTKVPSILSVVIIVLLFQPIKIRVEKFVDKKFFRVQYDFRTALNSFIEEIKQTNDINSLADKIVRRTIELIPVNKIGFFHLQLPGNRIRLLAHRNFDFLVGRSVRFEMEKLRTNIPYPVAVFGKVESGVKVEIADKQVFQRWGMDLVFTLKSASKRIFGFLVLGEKKSGQRFSAEDIDLLNTFTTTAAATIEKFQLQEEVISKRLEAERLEELNQLKSYFVSSVSHDLKTPLTSIKMFAELMKTSKNISSKKSNEYFEIIEGESNRLTRLIDTVLNHSKIESGVKEYKFEEINLSDVVQNVLRSMEYQFKMKNFFVNTSFGEESIMINADADGVTEALINLLSNALKYSEDEKLIKVSTCRMGEYATIEVRDYGIGIPSEDLENIFASFYRSKNLSKDKIGGAGIGLTIVKHIMDAHKGKIEVTSILEKGSTFILHFPLRNKNE
ncbi:MAG: PDZ domain-containing protein [Ignavibacteria bacterium]|nr:PDZ domain-containing protein [Ignavibacteria bacterium]